MEHKKDKTKSMLIFDQIISILFLVPYTDEKRHINKWNMQEANEAYLKKNRGRAPEGQPPANSALTCQCPHKGHFWATKALPSAQQENSPKKCQTYKTIEIYAKETSYLNIPRSSRME